MLSEKLSRLSIVFSGDSFPEPVTTGGVFLTHFAKPPTFEGTVISSSVSLQKRFWWGVLLFPPNSFLRWINYFLSPMNFFLRPINFFCFLVNSLLRFPQWKDICPSPLCQTLWVDCSACIGRTFVLRWWRSSRNIVRISGWSEINFAVCWGGDQPFRM